jgi:NADH-quinone oxidoreductase subunit I
VSKSDQSGERTQPNRGSETREDLPGSRLAWFTRLYLPTIAKGMMVSMRHFFMKPVTIQYPEQKAKISERFRGEHRLTKDAEGKMKCVACYMCATACPAHCITIEAQAAPPEWENRDKIPKVFEIDMLKCIYCGYCVEACPKEAIEMTNKIPQVYDNRQDFIYGLKKLLNN